MKALKNVICMGSAIAMAGALSGASVSAAEIIPVKNVIVMISDGAGYNTHLSTEYWQGGTEPYNNSDFKYFPVSTFNLRLSGPGDDTQDTAIIYDSAKAWDNTPVAGDADGDGYFDYFKGYQWLQATDPDSAGTMSAIVTGRKVYRGGINIDGFGNPLLTVPEMAKALGKSTGSISSVRYNHATPAAGGGAHNISRNNYIDISYEMFGAGVLDLVGGTGHPWYYANGEKRDEPNLTSNRFDKRLWKVISKGVGKAFRTTVDGREFVVDGRDWQMYDEKSDIEALANGTTTVPDGKKLVLLPKVWGTLQYERDVTADWDNDGTVNNHHPVTGANLDLGRAPVNPGDDSAGDPRIPTVPMLVDMTMASLNYLDDNPMGFYLQVEGGACDWAMHGNSMARMIEEHIDFNNSVQAVIDYLNAGTNGNNWSNTLLIITADHDHNLYGPQSDVIAFQDVSDNGAGQLPGHLWHDDNHGNQLVPAWVRGPNADMLEALYDGVDSVHGQYIDQVDLGDLMMTSIVLN